MADGKKIKVTLVKGVSRTTKGTARRCADSA